MSKLKKTARKIGQFSSKALGAAIGMAVGGPFGAIAGYKVGDMAGDAIIKVGDKAIGKPKAPEPTVLAMPDEEEIRRQQRRALASRAGRTGRQSTILSGGDETLG